MTHICLPENIEYVLSRLEKAGHRAYAVGGCIRDCLLERTPDDWDITTSALPTETMELFGEIALPTGSKHGTVTVKHGGSIEVTTFRADGQYSDHRHPDSVSFVKNVEDDLARRDFTMNAMAMGLSRELIDPFGGISDIEKGLICCVGEAEKRFEEDALRILRALRFSAKLGFEIEENTLKAIFSKAYLAEALAVERIETELSKMLIHPCAGQLRLLFSCGLMERFCQKTELDFSLIEKLPETRLARYAGLCALLNDAGLIDCESFLSALRCDALTIRSCAKGLGVSTPKDDAQWKRLIYSIGENACYCTAAAAFISGQQDSFERLESVLKKGECYTLAQLNVKGSELAALGYSGKDIGTALEKLLMHVIEHPEDNDKDILLKMIT